MVSKKIDYGVAAYIFGIASIVFAIFKPDAGIVLGIIGLVLGRRQNDVLSQRARKFSTIGIILGIIVLILTVVLVSVFAPIGPLA